MEPQKRSAEEAESLLVGVRSILFDIEGTTTPISFVKDTLFPYVKNHIESFLNKNFENADVQKAVAALRDQAAKEKDEKVEGVVEIPSADASKEDVVTAVVSNVRWQMQDDRKTTELKNLQGLIWKDAYKTKEIKGELFDDVAPVLKLLSDEGFHNYVYSSGSIESQKLLFANSNQGNLLHVFSGYFDTTTGSKKESASYKKIASEIKTEPNCILFLTDSPEEGEAADAAGLRVALVIRPGNAELSTGHLQKFACIERFDELYGDDDDEEDDIKRFAGDNGEQDDEDDDDDEEDGDDA
uniref:Acireductone synthase n=1 Tax=Arion vulgaris TaxID=1028688 RepID=A0A0B7BED8_9EUPU